MSKKNDTDNHIEIEKKEKHINRLRTVPKKLSRRPYKRPAGEDVMRPRKSLWQGAPAHMWEEPCISGDAGSGAVFFFQAADGCVFVRTII